MNIKIEKVFERDVDLLIINNIVNGNLLALFLNMINKSNYCIDSVEHSYQDQNGENDITVILSNGQNKIGLLIEDKIDAPAMEEQAARYSIRGENLKSSKNIDEYFVFIIAPQKYLDNNAEAQRYPNKISYETLISNLSDDYSKAILNKALDESKNGYSVKEDKAVTEFWNNLYDYIEDVYDEGVLNINVDRGPKGSRAFWPTFFTNFKPIKIIYKSNQGNVELEFSKAASKYNDLKNRFIKKGIPAHEIIIKGDTVVIQKHVDVVNFAEPFKKNVDKVNKALKAVVELYNLLNYKDLNLDYDSVFGNTKLVNPSEYDLSIVRDGLIKYEKIMESYKKTQDVSKNLDFQRMYDGFYRVRRNEEWRKYYFKLMQEMRNKDVSFGDILTLINEETGRIEASFASKLLATINPNYPIWDQYVLANIGLEATPQYMSNDIRLEASIEIYDEICDWYKERINSDEGKAEIEFFDSKFPKFKWISNIKKIDFLLWSKR